ncbi:MAG: hypothetical protein ACOC80_16635, partial [Petrotogales bacterium]
DIGDDAILKIIAQANRELNRMINVSVTRERVEFIDQTRENDIDGNNKTFYVKNWKGKYIGDKNGDGSISSDDVTVYKVDSQSNETEVAVDSVDSAEGKITLENAPDSGDDLYISYNWCYVDPDTPDPTLELACTLLTAAYCYAKINIGRAPRVSFGNTKLYRHMGAFDHYYSRFEKIVSKLNSSMPDNRESKHNI